MIQRKQSLYLLLAAALIAATYFFSLWHVNFQNGNDTVLQTKYLRIAEHLPLLISMVTSVILILVCLFSFKNYSRQILLGALSTIALAGFIVLCLMKISSIQNDISNPQNATYSLTMVLPFAAIAAILIALFYIRKDKKLIDSLNHLR